MARTTSIRNSGGKTKQKVGTIGMKEFHGMLILAQWARSFFQGSDFKILQHALHRKNQEGVNPDSGQTRFFHELIDCDLFNMNKADRVTFSRYDTNIVRHWNRITECRNKETGKTLKMKYYQYLTLLVTEVYLDWFFNRREELLLELNKRAEEYNHTHPRNRILASDGTQEGTPVFTEETLRKIAFWEATGSGKTLMLHINLLQYIEYAGKARALPDSIILLTPNERLSQQHLNEFSLSGIKAELMNETPPQGVETVYIVDSGKLISDTSNRKQGEKSFAAQRFEGKNLVLVDEGHHGSSNDDGEHRKTREMLCRDGFSFEYSATFGQAVAGKQTNELKSEYAKAILFDYSYRFFYEDGYGKESFILNLADSDNETHLFRYLCANLLSYYQQHYLFAKHETVMQRFLIAKPLCVFVGNTVNTTASDVERVVNFFADVLNRRDEVENIFGALLRNEDLLRMGSGNPLHGRYTPLKGRTPAAIYDDLLRKIFNADHTALLKLTYLKNSEEITLSVGESAPFGLITVGSASKLTDTLEKSAAGSFVVQRNSISKAHFNKINDSDSELTLLIGSRKFTEGWSSWRVSAMGLLNMGVKEGTQIIQLFGRGVRLRGHDLSLKRSTLEERAQYAKDAFLDYLETLQIFGVRANYMAQFKTYLDNEGVHTLDQVLTLQFPIRRNPIPKGLLVPQLKEGYAINQANGFKKSPCCLFKIPDDTTKKIKHIEVTYDDFAYVQVMRTNNRGEQQMPLQVPDVKLDSKAFPFFDWDGIYRELQKEKAQKGYWNMSINKQLLRKFADNDDSWYKLRTRPEDVTFDSFNKLANIERLFRILILAYMEQFYKRLQAVYEDEHREMRPLKENWIPTEYVFEIDNTDEGRVWERNLRELLKIVENSDVPQSALNHWMQSCGDKSFVVITFKQHLYSPLLYKEKKSALPFTYKPVSLGAESEVKFINDLQKFYYSKDAEPYFKDIDLYLMRNAADKLKGIGFAQAGNFYPDFMMWIIDKVTGQQYLTFIDPKGLRNVSLNAPKLNLGKEIRHLQKCVNEGREKPIILNSLILSSTRQDDEVLKQHTEEEFAAQNVLFLNDKDYLKKLFRIARSE